MKFLRELVTVILLAVVTTILICATGIALDKYSGWDEPEPVPAYTIQLQDQINQCLIQGSEIKDEIKKLGTKLDDAMGEPTGGKIGTEV